MNKKTMTFLLGCLLTASVATQVSAQQPVRHELIRGDLPPGEAAHFYQQANPSLIGHKQAVQLVAPKDTTIEVGDAASSFGQARAGQMTVAMGIGYVYRFKLSNLPQPDALGKTLYPSIEVIGKLSPPPGLENDFPIQAVVTRDDIDLALEGRMVTRVIYLEDPRGTLPHLHTEREQPSMDVPRGQDPLRAAEQMGRPMAILRMGSRVPLENEVAEWFAFGVAAPQVLPNPRPANLAGLSDYELSIIREMERAEAGEVLETKIQKQADIVSRTDSNIKDTAQLESSQITNEQLNDGWTNSIEDKSQQVPADAPNGQAPSFDSAKPKLIKIKANLASQANQPSLESMNPAGTRLEFDKESTARPPAPSMSMMYFEPLEDDVKKEESQPSTAPMLRLPNEL